MGSSTVPADEQEPREPRRPSQDASRFVVCWEVCRGALATAVHWLVPPYSDRGWIDRERKVPPRWHIDAPADNAREDYAEACNLLPPMDAQGPRLAWWTETVLSGDQEAIRRDLPRAKALVEQSVGALAKLHEAAAKRYAWGEPPSTSAPLALDLKGVPRLARFATGAALVAHVEGRDDEALRLLEDVAAVGFNHDNGESTLQLSIGSSVVTRQTMCTARVILHGHPSDDALRAHIAVVEDLRRRPSGLASSLAFEAESVIRACAEMATASRRLCPAPPGPTRGRGLPQPPIRATDFRTGNVRAWFADRLARLIEEARKPARQRDLAAFRARTERDVAARSDWVAELAEGATTVALQFVSMRARLGAQEVMCALELHRREHGAYPADLAALVPDHLAELPEDPFSGDPLVYRLEQEGYTLYSVGPNKTDDGGVSKGSWAMEPDEVFVGGTYIESADD